MEFCYRLNVPDFQTIVRKDWKHNLSYDALIKLPAIIPAENVIQKQYLNFNDLVWDEVIRFPLKTIHTTKIHSDNRNETDLENPKLLFFAINYVVSGSGRIDYYLPSQLESKFIDDDDPSLQENWTSTQEPYKSYEMTQGNVYLLNVTVPHKAVAYEERLVFSLRPSLKDPKILKLISTTTWEQIVDSFKDYFIPNES